MRQTSIDAEVIQLSAYCDIVVGILNCTEQMSINKVVVFSYILKKNKFYRHKVFTANSKINIVIKALTLLNGLRDDYLFNIEYIIRSIDILVKKEVIIVKDDGVLLLNDNSYLPKIEITVFFKSVLEESKNFTDRQFLKEVLDNV